MPQTIANFTSWRSEAGPGMPTWIGRVTPSRTFRPPNAQRLRDRIRTASRNIDSSRSCARTPLCPAARSARVPRRLPRCLPDGRQHRRPRKPYFPSRPVSSTSRLLSNAGFATVMSPAITSAWSTLSSRKPASACSSCARLSSLRATMCGTAASLAPECVRRAERCPAAERQANALRKHTCPAHDLFERVELVRVVRRGFDRKVAQERGDLFFQLVVRHAALASRGGRGYCLRETTKLSSLNQSPLCFLSIFAVDCKYWSPSR